jgi:hypothetical protein
VLILIIAAGYHGWVSTFINDVDEGHVDLDLAEGLAFAPDDLVANRGGVMTERQRTALKARADFKPAVLTGLFYLWGLVTLGAVDSSIPTTDKVAVSIASLVLIAIIAAGFRSWANMFIADANEGAVEGLVGWAILDAPPSFKLTIDQQTFRLKKKAYLCFNHLDYYTIYYAPRSKVILSAESMG